MAYTQTDLDNVNAAIATGEQSVEVAGRKVVFRSVEELLKAKSDIIAELAATANAGASTDGTRRGAFRVTFATHRGD